MLTELEKKIVASIQGDIPVTERPYLEIAESIGISEETLLKTLIRLKNRGVIRRFGATIRHQESGFAANAMVAWIVAEGIIDEIGIKMASFPEVTHCYRRQPTKGWPYNLYTMIHAKDEASCRAIASALAEKTSVEHFILLFSRNELKKTSMKYFPNKDEN